TRAPPPAVPERTGSTQALTEAAPVGLSEQKPTGTLSEPGKVVIHDPSTASTLRLAYAPQPALVENGPDGPLPRVAADGTRPLDAYARPADGKANDMRIAIVIGGVGIDADTSEQAIALPGPVTLALAPYGDHLKTTLAEARDAGHELLLQIPLEPFNYPRTDPGPQTLTVDAPAAENLDRLHWLMSRTTNYVGVVNYMGGRFTGEAEALANAVNSLQGMLALMDVTGDPAEFARTVRVHREGTVPGVPGAYNKWNQGAEGYADMDWECCGNNDMVAGIFYSFAVAWTMLPDDAAYDDERARMADQSERLVALLNVTDDKDLGSDSNKVTANGLAYALTGKPEYLTAYNENFSDGLELILQAGGGMLYEWGISDWSGQHLTTIDLYSRYLASVLVDDVERLPLYATGWSTGMGLTKDVRYTLWPFVAYGTSEPESKHDEVLEEAIWTMREVPFPKEQFYIDPRVDPDYCVSPLPSLFWKLDWMDGGRHQGLYAKPIFQRGAATAYYWKDNPLAVDQTPGSIKDPSADYTHAYWMGRYFGIYDETE
ncbi:divergent polysaccharide deacetylase family protein, partial [bacterium]|nr:divergent polysaccharide deacetylase family protein [bacterium]